MQKFYAVVNIKTNVVVSAHRCKWTAAQKARQGIDVVCQSDARLVAGDTVGDTVKLATVAETTRMRHVAGAMKLRMKQIKALDSVFHREDKDRMIWEMGDGRFLFLAKGCWRHNTSPEVDGSVGIWAYHFLPSVGVTDERILSLFDNQ